MLSHFKGPTEPPKLQTTIGDALVSAAERWGDLDALISVHQQRRFTYSQLLEEVDRLASNLIALGLQKGDRIGIWSPNCFEWVLTQFAAARAGLVFVTINPAYRLHEAEYTFNKVGVRALVVSEKFKTSDYTGMVEALAPELSSSEPGQLRSSRLLRVLSLRRDLLQLDPRLRRRQLRLAEQFLRQQTLLEQFLVPPQLRLE